MAGKFYVVATPIGNLQDISLRAMDILANVDLILAEDTRHSKSLLEAHGIKNQLKSLHEHNEQQSIDKIIVRLEEEKDIALVSDAGTPLISDPGFKLVRAIKKLGFSVVPVPGASALITALSASGLPTDKFCFEGFLPKTDKARKDCLQVLLNETRTIMFYESPKRVIKTLQAMALVFGADRLCCVARELTKKYESIITDTLENVHELFTNKAEPARGEFVIILAGSETKPMENEEVLRVLKILLTDLPTKQAVRLSSQITGMNKNQVYDMALHFKKQ